MYNSTSINDSYTITGVAGAEITNGCFLAVKWDANGNLVLAGAGEVPAGVIPAGVTDTVKVGEDLTIQVQGIALVKAGGAVNPGEFVSCDASGNCVKATDGAAVLGQAFEKAEKSGDVIKVQIFKSAGTTAAASKE